MKLLNALFWGALIVCSTSYAQSDNKSFSVTCPTVDMIIKRGLSMVPPTEALNKSFYAAFGDDYPGLPKKFTFAGFIGPIAKDADIKARIKYDKNLDAMAAQCVYYNPQYSKKDAKHIYGILELQLTALQAVGYINPKVHGDVIVVERTITKREAKLVAEDKKRFAKLYKIKKEDAACKGDTECLKALLEKEFEESETSKKIEKPSV